MEYIMAPEMYYSLTRVSGFTECNGETYKEHILIIFNDKLSEKERLYILEAGSDDEALSRIPFKFTHNFEKAHKQL